MARSRILRPLLAVWRAEIDDYLVRQRLKFREDATNEELHARRNRVRHRIIPWLEKEFGRSIRPTIWRAAAVLAEEEDLLETMTPLRPNEKRGAAGQATAPARACPSASRHPAVAFATWRERAWFSP
jgi:tRNA(Ile)-lysidine synthase TilS/MesJ